MALLDAGSVVKRNAGSDWLIPSPPCSILQDRQEQCSFKSLFHQIYWIDYVLQQYISQSIHTPFGHLYTPVSLSLCPPACIPHRCLSSVISSDAALWRVILWETSVLPHSPHPHLSASHARLLFYEQGSSMHEQASLIYLLLSCARPQAWPLGLLVL